MDEVRLPLVSEIMGRTLAVVSPKTPALEAARLMCERNIGCVVVSDNGRAEGIFTERDLLRQVAQRSDWQHVPVEEFMTPEPVTVRSDDSLAVAVEVLQRADVRHLPVTDAGGRLVGALSVRDMMRHRASYLEWLVRQRNAELRAKNEALERRDRMLQRHLEIAGRTQRRMLPPAQITAEPFQLTVWYHPLEQVSGDYFDFVELEEGRFGLLIADASGHSVPAALVSVAAKAVFHTEGRHTQSPQEVLRVMNRYLFELVEAEHFVTMFSAVVDRARLTVTFANAGHPEPLWRRGRTGTVSPLEATGLMLGVSPDPSFEQQSVKMEPGDAMLLYTDGLVECRNPQGELFGRERLAQAFAQIGEAPPEQVVDHITRRLDQFRQENPPDDDMTCIAMQVRSE